MGSVYDRLSIPFAVWVKEREETSHLDDGCSRNMQCTDSNRTEPLPRVYRYWTC